MDHLAVTPFVATCILICTIVSILLKLRPRRDFYEKVSKFPGPPTLPLIGNAHLFAGSTEGLLDRIAQLCNSYCIPARAWIGNYAMIYINSPEHLKVVLNSSKTLGKGPVFTLAEPWLGTGLFTAPEAEWRVRRKLIQPTFSLTILQSFVKIFATRSAIIVREMERNLDGSEFDVHDYTSKFALHTICETTMGVDLQSRDVNGRFAKTVDELAFSMCKRALSPWLHPDFIFYLTKLGRNQKKNIKFLHAFTDNVIRAKKDRLLEEKLQPSSADKEESTGNNISRKKILLDHLIEIAHNSETFSDQALREEVDTMILAGSDTTALISSYVMLMLASHPEVQENVYQEICEIYGVNDSDELNFTPADLTRMSYMERVIKETMRLFPVAPLLIRWVSEDLDIGDHILPEGSQVLLSIMDVHRDEKYWPDPLKFDPDRFLPEEVEKRHPYAYIPFSGGPRGCIGSKYAMMSMKILLSTILRKYILKIDTVTPVEDFRFKWEFAMRPLNPILLRIERRTQNTPASI